MSLVVAVGRVFRSQFTYLIEDKKVAELFLLEDEANSNFQYDVFINFISAK
jgi:hypothetical protein